MMKPPVKFVGLQDVSEIALCQENNEAVDNTMFGNY
jgi:hypothetical protein